MGRACPGPVMTPLLGWGLAMAAVASGYLAYGWPGVALAFTVIVFWLLLLLSRALRVMRRAGKSPIGHVDSALMLQSRLKTGMRLIDVLGLTHSLGERVGEEPEVWRWHDSGGDAVALTFESGRLSRWQIVRAA